MRHKLRPPSFPARPGVSHRCGRRLPVVSSASGPGSPRLGCALTPRYARDSFAFSDSAGGGESRLEGGRVSLEKSAEVQSVVRRLRRQVKGLEGWGRRGGRGGRRAGGVLRGQGRRRPFFSHQDLAEDDGEQEEEEPFGRIRILSRQLAPDLSGDDQGDRSARAPTSGHRPATPPGHPLRRHSPPAGRGPYGCAFGARGRRWGARRGPPPAPGEGRT